MVSAGDPLRLRGGGMRFRDRLFLSGIMPSWKSCDLSSRLTNSLLAQYNVYMKLVVKLKLATDTDTDRLLRETTQQYRRGCNHLSEIAFSTKTFDRFDLHDLAYYQTKALFELPSQL